MTGLTTPPPSSSSSSPGITVPKSGAGIGSGTAVTWRGNKTSNPLKYPKIVTNIRPSLLFQPNPTHSEPAELTWHPLLSHTVRKNTNKVRTIKLRLMQKKQMIIYYLKITRTSALITGGVHWKHNGVNGPKWLKNLKEWE